MTPTGEIFVKFDIDDFYKNLSMNSDVTDYKKKPETLRDYLCTFLNIPICQRDSVLHEAQSQATERVDCKSDKRYGKNLQCVV